MSKYPGTYTTKDVYKAEVKECKNILKKYHASKEDVETITSMIEHPYYLLSNSYKMSNAIEAYVKDMLGEDGLNDFFQKFVTKRKEAGKNLSEYMQKLQEEYWKEMEKLKTSRGSNDE